MLLIYTLYAHSLLGFQVYTKYCKEQYNFKRSHVTDKSHGRPICNMWLPLASCKTETWPIRY